MTWRNTNRALLGLMIGAMVAHAHPSPWWLALIKAAFWTIVVWWATSTEKPPE